MVKHEEYIIDSVCNEVVDEDYVKEIENKVINKQSLTQREADELLKYVVLSTRRLVTTDIQNENYVNKCDMCQSIICNYLNQLGIENHPNMTQNSISDYIVGHSFVVINLNIEGIDKQFLIDPAYKQFFIKENCQASKQLIIRKMKILNPDPGYYIKEEDKFLVKKFLDDGYMELNEYSAKVYGDSFYLTKVNIPAEFKMPQMSGKIYINSFKRGNVPLTQYNIGEIEVLSENQKIR